MSKPRNRLVLELSCVVAASREQVFDLLTKPDELVKWWGPQGFTTPEAEVNLSVGGGYRFAMEPPDGEAFHLAGRFLHIEPPSRLRYSFVWEEPHPDDRETVVELSLRAIGDATQVSLSHGDFATEERLALHRGGWTDALVKLRELVVLGGKQHQPRPGESELPLIDEHRIVVPASRDHVWRVLRRHVDSLLGFRARNPLGWVLGTQPRPGFEIEREVPREQLSMTGRHRFSRYRLVFRLADVAPQETQLSARTYAEFPGHRGRAYRALVIGTGLHVVAVKQILRSIRRSSLG